MVTSWSHSKLGDFEKCKRYFWLKHDQKIPEPERPLKPGQTEHANDRGSRIHDNCEKYVKGETDTLAPEAEKHFGFQLDLMRVLYAEGMVHLEGEWGMDQNWEPTGWVGAWEKIEEVSARELGVARIPKHTKLPERGRDGDVVRVGKQCWLWVPTWLRLKLDALVFLHATHAVAIDYKTGRKFGNEAKHAEQLYLYQLVTFLRYPKLEKVTTELWYLDQGFEHTTSQTFTRAQGLRFRPAFDKRGTALTTCTEFPPNPSVHACRWCQYGSWNGGQCQDGIQATTFPKKGR